MKKQRVLDSYARESIRGDKRNLSITGQHEVNRERITDLGCTRGLELQDKGKSAWKPGVKRPDWEQLIARLEARESNGAVIFDLERLLRRTEDALRIIGIAEQGFLIYDSDMEFDLTTPSGRKAFRDAASAAEYYSDRLSSKVSRANRQAAVAGRGKRGRYRAFGFENDSTTVRESERRHIRRVDVMVRTEGATWTEAVAYLAGQGLTTTAIDHTPECTEKKEALTPHHRKVYTCDCPGRPWQPDTLQTAMKSPRMAGYAQLGKELLGRLPGEPILDPADWQELKALIASRRGRPPIEATLCSGTVPVRCGGCGGRLYPQVHTRRRTYGMTDMTTRPGSDYPDAEEVRRFYMCNRRAARRTGTPCGRCIADRYVLDRIVAAMVIGELSNPESAEELARIQGQKKQQRTPYELEIDRLSRIRDHWDRQLNEGTDDMTIERHSVLTGDLNKKIAAARGKLAEIGDADFARPAAESRAAVERKWSGAGPEGRRDMLRQAFGERTIYVLPGSSLDMDDAVMDRIRPEVP